MEMVSGNGPQKQQQETPRQGVRAKQARPAHPAPTVKPAHQINWHRQQVLITPDQKKWLDRQGFERGMSDGQLIRELIDYAMTRGSR